MKEQGQVKFFDSKKGFGFIESGGKDYFAHYSEIQAQGYKVLEDGQKVMFKISQGRKGLQATDITF